MLVFCENLRGSIACIPEMLETIPSAGEMVRNDAAESPGWGTVEEKVQEEAPFRGLSICRQTYAQRQSGETPPLGTSMRELMEV
jgi:hypothetical protein